MSDRARGGGAITLVLKQLTLLDRRGVVRAFELWRAIRKPPSISELEKSENESAAISQMHDREDDRQLRKKSPPEFPRREDGCHYARKCISKQQRREQYFAD